MQLTRPYDPPVEQPYFVEAVTSFKHPGTSKVIGPEGGVITVADPQSRLFGTSLRVPAEALDIPVQIFITEGEHACDFGLAPSIKLLPTGLQFKRSVTLKICLDGRCDRTHGDSKAVEPAVYHYDESNNQWAYDSAARLERHGNTVLCDLKHL